MLRFLAFMFVVTASLLMQGEPAAAHESRFAQLTTVSEGPTGSPYLEMSAVDVDGYSSETGCCMASCAPCKLPLPERIGAAATAPSESSAVQISADDCYGSNIPDHEPPVPKPYLV